MKLKRWLVFTEQLVDGKHWHGFWTRAARRRFHKQHGGERFDVIRSRHG